MRLSLVMLVLALLLTGSALSACSRGTASLPSEQPLLTGTITRHEDGRILIETDPTQPDGAPKCWLAVDSKTAVYQEAKEGPQKAAVSDLAVGQKVRAWASGPVLESYPCQGGAHTLLILNP